MSAKNIVAKLSRVQLTGVFNPYADICEVHDLHSAAKIRRGNLYAFLSAAKARNVTTIWMGRDLGYRGGRRTGIALTDEPNLDSLKAVFDIKVAKATRSPSLSERTACEIWSTLREISSPPFLWNVFPLHPYGADTPFTNRRFQAKELEALHEVNCEIFDYLGIQRAVSIGKDAARYCERLGIPVEVVRHPSYGGVLEFRAGIGLLHPAQPKPLQLNTQSTLF